MIIAAAGTLIWLHQSKPNHVEARTPMDLRLEMSFSQNKYVRHEPIEFRSKLSNQTSERIMLQPPIKFDPRIDFLVQRENGSEIRWKSKDYYGYHHGSVVFGTPSLQPGKVSEVRYLIDEEFATRMFAQPGRYRVRIEFDYEDLSTSERQRQTILSDHTFLEIEELRGANLLASTYLRNVIEPERGNWRLDERLPALRHFFNTFRDSVYWKYVAYELGSMLVEKQQYQAAEDVLYEISDVDFFYSKQVANALRECAIGLTKATPRTRRVPDPSTFPALTLGPPYVPGPSPSHIPAPVRVPVPSPTPENLPDES